MKSGYLKTTNRRSQRQERGVALIIALFAVLLLSFIAFGLMGMATQDTRVNSNYRDAQRSYFAAVAGLEEVRDRMRPTHPNPIALPTDVPGNPNGLIYMINPAGPGDNVDPINAANRYFDDELCHENFPALGLAAQPVGVPCNAGPAAGAVNNPYLTSVAPFANTAGAMDYKWVRITWKTNSALAPWVVDGSALGGPTANTVVCWNGISEALLPAGFPTCSAASMTQVYLLTAMALTPNNGRRMFQYEVTPVAFPPLPSPLTLNGPGGTYGTTHSANFAISGTDTGAAGYNGPGACNTNLGSKPAIGVWNPLDQTTVSTGLFRPNNYTGQAPTPPNANGSSVLNLNCPTCPPVVQSLTTPSALDQMVQAITNGADQVFQGPVSNPGSLGTNAAPMITVVQGDLTLSGATTGAGILLVTGTLTLSGNSSFNGMVLAIGKGVVNVNGGGSGQFNGGWLVANIYDNNGNVLPTLGAPSVNWNGGGGNGIQYNSCWINGPNNAGYAIIGSREEMY